MAADREPLTAVAHAGDQIEIRNTVVIQVDRTHYAILQFVVCGRVDNFAVRWRWADQHPHSRCARGQRIEVQPAMD
jgi:hypothetical protein